jgi:hypothetical protein
MTIHGPGVFVTCVKGKERLAGKEIREVFELVRVFPYVFEYRL